MPLPSQSQNSSVRGRYMYRRRRKRRGPKILLAPMHRGHCRLVVVSLHPTSAQPSPLRPPLRRSSRLHLEPLPATASTRTVDKVANLTAPTPVPASTPAGRRLASRGIDIDCNERTNGDCHHFEPLADNPFFQTDDVITLARQHLAEGDLLTARTILSQAVQSNTLSAAADEEARYMATAINDRLVFSSEIIPGDPYSLQYVVRSGDSLSKIVKNLGLQVDWRFIQRINALPRPDTIRVGQTLKVVTGPFHADINRDRHRLSLYLGEGPNRVFVRDFLVGLGEYDSTPSGLFRVREHSKLVNPPWTNPRTREQYTANDPNNPIGEFWLGLEGIDEHNRQEAGFGLHGTIDPDSIGRNESMGCVRLDDGDIDLIYEVLAEGVSIVDVEPSGSVAGVPGG